MKAVDDAPLIRMREIQKRQREKQGAEESSAIPFPSTPNIPGLKFREKKKERPMTLEEIRLMR